VDRLRTDGTVFCMAPWSLRMMATLAGLFDSCNFLSGCFRLLEPLATEDLLLMCAVFRALLDMAFGNPFWIRAELLEAP
jgi:hypothetical protein